MGYLDESEVWDAAATGNQDIAYTGTSAVNGTALAFGDGVYLEIETTTDAYFAQVAAGGTVTSTGRRISAYSPKIIRSKTGYIAFIRRTTSGTAMVNVVKKA